MFQIVKIQYIIRQLPFNAKVEVFVGKAHFKSCRAVVLANV